MILSLSANAATKTWDGNGGGGGGSNWSGGGANGANNWNPNGVPASGDDLIFAGSFKTTPNNNITGFTANSITFASGAAAFTLEGNAITLGGNVTNNSNNLQTIDMALGLNGNRIFAAISDDLAISGVISGSFGIEKTGANDLFLTAANTHTGTTTVTTGSLFADNTTGSATGSGAVDVGASGTLRGTGTMIPTGSNAINVSGVLFPGDDAAIGTLTFNLASTTGGVTMSGDAGLAFRLGLPGADIDTVGVSDLVALAGASAGDFAFNDNVIDFQDSGSLGFYKLLDTSLDNASTWTGLTIDGSGLITSGLGYTNLADGYSALLIMGGGSYGGDTGDIYLQVVPEPGAAFLGGLGTLLLLRRRRA
jgi:autotransporter-associated beta strand protein